jgi:hypothetical protein
VRAEAVRNRFCGNCSHGSRPDPETGVLCCGKELLPKHYAEAGSVSLSQGYVHTSAFLCISQGAEAGYVAPEEKGSGADREPRYHIWWGQSPQRSSGQLLGKRKANELASSGDSPEPANRRPAPGAGSPPLPANSTVTGEQAAFGSLQLVSPEGGVTYAASRTGSVAPLQPSGSLKPTTMGSDLSEPAV